MARPEVQERLSRAVEDIDATIRDLRRRSSSCSSSPVAAARCGRPEGLVDDYTRRSGSRRSHTPGRWTVSSRRLCGPRSWPRSARSVERCEARTGRRRAGRGRGDGSGRGRRITDDGVGITPNGRQSGLRNLRGTGRNVRGAVRVERAEPHGTVLSSARPSTWTPASREAFSASVGGPRATGRTAVRCSTPRTTEPSANPASRLCGCPPTTSS